MTGLAGIGYALLRFADPLASRRFLPWNLRCVVGRKKVPVVLQLNAVECGAACLAMILSYFGRKTRLEECRVALDCGRDGVSAQSVVAAGRRFGLRTKALSLPAEGLSQVNHPCIVHWNGSHFVVLERWIPSWWR